MADPLRILVTGGTGGIGRRFVRSRLQRGDEVFVVSRRSDEARRLFAAGATRNIHVLDGDPGIPGRWQQTVGEVDAVVHLAGAPIAAARWTTEIRETIRRSRVEGTYQVAFAIRESETPPRVLVSASGTGRYAAGPDPIDESAPAGRGFLSEVAEAWEREAMRAASDRTRVVVARIPTVLDREAGYLARMSSWWRRGVDPSPWASGEAVPWVHHLDLVRMLESALGDESLAGPVNFTAPNAATAAGIRDALRAILGKRPLPLPRRLVRLAGGAAVDELAGSRDVVPARLHARKFEWKVESVAEALAIELGHGVVRQTTATRTPVVPPKPVEPPRPAPVVPPKSVEPPKPAPVVPPR
ncbi:MAG: NAD-dependent epimerase/dehydratase family protein, partial [Phycisphaerales bacterium]